MLIGMQAKKISRTIGVEVNTVVTDKKRAFEKLGIATRRELQSCYQRKFDTRQ